MTLSELWWLVGKIPAAFWGVLVGAFFSLGGVYLTNRASERRLRQQLLHDREIRNRERELSLRKEVYLAAAEAVAAGLNAIYRFPNLEIPNDKVTELYVEKSSSIAKSYVIAKEDTIKAIGNFVGELNAAYYRLFSRRVPLTMQKQKLATLNNQVSLFNRECGQMVELMKQFNLGGETDKQRWETIQNNFKFFQKSSSEAQDQYNKAATDLNLKQIEYTKDCAAEDIKLSRLLAPALLTVRAELELPIGEATLNEVFENNMRLEQDSLNKFFEDTGRLIAIAPESPKDTPKKIIPPKPRT